MIVWKKCLSSPVYKFLKRICICMTNSKYSVTCSAKEYFTATRKQKSLLLLNFIPPSRPSSPPLTHKSWLSLFQLSRCFSCCPFSPFFFLCFLDRKQWERCLFKRKRKREISVSFPFISLFTFYLSLSLSLRSRVDKSVYLETLFE